MSPANERLSNITMLKPNEVAFLEAHCGLSYVAAKKAVGQGECVPFWSFFISDEPLTEDDISRAHQLITEHELED